MPDDDDFVPSSPFDEFMRCYDKQGRRITVERMGELRYPPFDEPGLKPYAVVGDWYGVLAGTEPNEGNLLRVSTVWMGHDLAPWRDGPPIIFETMIFAADSHPWDNACTRYATEAEALEGHDRTVTDLMDGRTPWFIHDSEAFSR